MLMIKQRFITKTQMEMKTNINLLARRRRNDQNLFFRAIHRREVLFHMSCLPFSQFKWVISHLHDLSSYMLALHSHLNELSSYMLALRSHLNELVAHYSAICPILMF